MDIARQFVEFVDGRSFYNFNISLCVPTIVCSFFIIVIIIVIIIVAIWLKLFDCARMFPMHSRPNEFNAHTLRDSRCHVAGAITWVALVVQPSKPLAGEGPCLQIRGRPLDGGQVRIH